MNMLSGRVLLTSIAATLFVLGSLAAGEHRAAAQITGLAVDNTNSSGSVSNGTGQNICTTTVSGTVAPLGGNVSESRNQVSVVPASQSPTGFTTRFVADLCTDSGGSTIVTVSCTAGPAGASLTANYNTNFGVNAPSGTNYRLTVNNQINGAVDLVADAGSAATANVSQVATTETGGVLFGGGNLNLTNGLPILNRTAAGTQTFTNPSQVPTTVYIGAGSGAPNPHTINTQFNASCSTPSNGNECGIRIGLGCSINGAALTGDTTTTAGHYPGSPARDPAADGQFVSVALEFCGDGKIQQDGVLNEQCDNGLDPVSGNGGSASCCNTDCTVKTNGTTCRPAGGECDLADMCNGISAACPADAKKGNGTACTDDGNPCSSDLCNGVSNACQHTTPGNSGALCRASADPNCDPAEFCDGLSTTCPADTHQPDGFLCAMDGNPCTLDVCSSGSCTHPVAPAGAVCRAATDDCDAAELCDGTNVTCPADGVKPSGTTCADDGKLCTSDICDGTSKACQHTGIHTQGFVCRPAIGTCDVDEVCDGTSPDCPPDAVETRQINCRDSQGVCDLEEKCTGTDPACPPDAKVAAGTVCRDAIGGEAGLCDVPETCDGIADTCPPDGVAPAGTLCRAATGVCDTEEDCDGTNKTCPPDMLTPATVVCRGSQGVCDAVEYCTGSFADCPFDLKDPNFSECRAVTPPGNVCDVAENCNGSDNDCPPDQFGPASNVCRDSAGECDVPEFCTGSSGVCPGDTFQPSSLTCRNAVGVCDLAENCTGNSATCPPDQFTTILCRPADSSGCDVDDFCSGTAPDCPPDAKKPDGSICSGTNENTCLNACVTGVCTDACPDCADLSSDCAQGCPRSIVVPNCCGNGVIDTNTGEQCDDGNQQNGDFCPLGCGISGNGSLIRGDVYNPATRDTTGCQFEYFVQNPPLDLDRFGQPAIQQVCVDQDPACDLDPTPGRCLFHVAVCLVNHDPNLPVCTPDGINTIKINNRPYLRKSSPQVQFVGANAAKFAHAINALFDPSQPQLGFSNHPPLTPDQHDLCSGGFLVEVYAASAGRVRQSTVSAQRFRVTSKDQHLPRHRRDTSNLTLICEARPLP